MNINDNTESLKHKIDELNNEAWELRVSDSNRALVLSEEAVKLARNINYTKGLAEGLRTFGFSHIRLSKNTEALQYLQESMQLFELLNDLRGQSTIYEYYGIIQRSFGNYSASLESLFKGLELTKQTGYPEGEALADYHIGVTYKYLGNLEQALEFFLQSLSIAREHHSWIAESYSLNNIGGIYFELGDHANALEYYDQSLVIRKNSGDKWGEAGCLDNIGFCYFKTDQYDKAIDFCRQSLEISSAINDQKGQGNALFHLGNNYERSGQYDAALGFYNRALEIRRQIGDRKGEAEILLFMAELYAKNNFTGHNTSKAFDLMHDALKIGNEIKANDLLSKIHQGFYDVCKKNKLHEDALIHLETYISIEKEMHTTAVNQKILNLEISHRIEKSRQEAEIYRLRNIELAGLYEEIKKQKEATEVQKKNVEETLVELKATQAQLIQSEKMASLGQLTAGIAHEIQNPLNFVNNFSEVNTELIDELKTELTTGNAQLAIEIANDIKENEQKINHHGKRADAIVKGMLQHSRISTGQKESTDINALADECLRLSYNALRAKDKNFNAEIKTDFDPDLSSVEGKINIVPQDISRVLINVINNAFYAVTEKKNALTPKGGQEYEPTVSVTTKRMNSPLGVGGIEIRVTDNGNGIPQKIVDKIFQPFFTTKPTGQGTGLGLSLSYDIVKAHGGEIKVESKEGEGSEFIIQLPKS